jgi:hypothetical protein
MKGISAQVLGTNLSHRFAEMSVRDILALKKASIRSAPLPPDSPSWEQVESMMWEEVEAAAQRNDPGFKTIRKLLSDRRFDRDH